MFRALTIFLLGVIVVLVFGAFARDVIGLGCVGPVLPAWGCLSEPLPDTIPGSMGMNTPLNFQLDGKNAAINGDFMLLAAELNPVIKILRANGIEVASVHNHMLDDEPRLIFMHFWAYGDAVDLAKGLKAALMRIGA